MMKVADSSLIKTSGILSRSVVQSISYGGTTALLGRGAQTG